MGKYKVLIADDRYASYAEEEKVLSGIDAEICFETSMDEDVLISRVGDVDGMIVNLAPVTSKVVGAMNKCKCIARYGVGCDNVDTAALKAKGIMLANVPDYCMEEVSDQAFALWMNCVRAVSRKDREIRKGKWNLAEIQPTHRITGRVFGFVGLGSIARRLLEKLAGFNLGKILVYDPFVTPEQAEQLGVEKCELDHLCQEADYISVHAPLLDQTRVMIGAKQFALMKPSAILVNTSRGPLIDEPAMIIALENNCIAAAGLDVFDTEPLPADSKLRSFDNVVLSDHAGWYSVESLSELKTKAAQNIADTLTKGSPQYKIEL